MNEEVRTEIINDLAKTAEILEVKEVKDLEELRNLSEQTIEYIAIHKDLELVSVTVLIYSLYKIENCLQKTDRSQIVEALRRAAQSLKGSNFGGYNSAIRCLFELVRNCNAKIKEHLQDVMDAARIKKGTALLHRGLSIGQAAGLMGLSNWDLQAYAGKAHLLRQHTETIPASKRLSLAFKLFDLEK